MLSVVYYIILHFSDGKDGFAGDIYAVTVNISGINLAVNCISVCNHKGVDGFHLSTFSFITIVLVECWNN